MGGFTHRDIIAGNIRRARHLAGLTMKQAAARMRELGYAEWSYQTFGHVEKCSRRVMAEELVGLALSLDTTVRGLLSPGGDGGVTLPSGDEVDGEAMAAMLDGREVGHIRQALLGDRGPCDGAGSRTGTRRRTHRDAG